MPRLCCNSGDRARELPSKTARDSFVTSHRTEVVGFSAGDHRRGPEAADIDVTQDIVAGRPTCLSVEGLRGRLRNGHLQLVTTDRAYKIRQTSVPDYLGRHAVTAKRSLRSSSAPLLYVSFTLTSLRSKGRNPERPECLNIIKVVCLMS
jgi:hypothetical protein